MLRIGDRLLISHPDFSMVIQRKANLIMMLNHGVFFKQYHVREAKLPQKQRRKSGESCQTMAWKGGKRVGLGTKEYWPAQSGSGWPARQLISCTQCRMQRTLISTNRPRRPVSVSPRWIWRS